MTPYSNSEQIPKAHVYRVTKCVDSDSGEKEKKMYLTLSPPSEISRTADGQSALP
jgi:hypothetical protein